MRKFSIAGLQLNLDYSNNRELVTTKIKNVVRRYPWINMVVVSELAVDLNTINFQTSKSFNTSALVILVILIIIYSVWW